MDIEKRLKWLTRLIKFDILIVVIALYNIARIQMTDTEIENIRKDMKALNKKLLGSKKLSREFLDKMFIYSEDGKFLGFKEK